MRRIGFVGIAVGVLLYGTQSWALAPPDLPSEADAETFTETPDGVEYALCKKGSLIDVYGEPLFGEEGPTATTAEAAADEFVQGIREASTAKNPQLADLDPRMRAKMLEWFDRSFQPARGLDYTTHTEHKQGTRFTRMIDNNSRWLDLLVEVVEHENSRFYVSHASVCADAIHVRDFEEGAPPGVFVAEQRDALGKPSIGNKPDGGTDD